MGDSPYRHGQLLSTVRDGEWQATFEACEPGTAARLRRMERIAKKYLRRMERLRRLAGWDAERLRRMEEFTASYQRDIQAETFARAVVALSDILSA